MGPSTALDFPLVCPTKDTRVHDERQGNVRQSRLTHDFLHSLLWRPAVTRHSRPARKRIEENGRVHLWYQPLTFGQERLMMDQRWNSPLRSSGFPLETQEFDWQIL